MFFIQFRNIRKLSLSISSINFECNFIDKKIQLFIGEIFFPFESGNLSVSEGSSSKVIGAC
jgi:hypothetical protein